jgi:gamma-glutamylcysteine synthetase
LSVALQQAEERAEALAAKLERSEKAREKAEADAATVEDLRQRLANAENALSDKIAQQIKREEGLIARFDAQNRRFASKLLPFYLSSFS